MSVINVTQAITELRGGAIVALPTETVYGLCGRIDSEVALKKIFTVKHRPDFDPLIVHVRNLEQAKGLCSEWPEVFDLLATKFWPGPLTLIAPKKNLVSQTITAGLPTVALRCPRHPIFLEVLQALGIPLAAPSANRFGRTSPTTAQHVEQEFSGQVPVVDGGPCAVGVESTVLTAELRDGCWQLKILRPGGIDQATIRKFLLDAKVKFEIRREFSKISPGHLKEHYQPASPLVLLQNKKWSAAIQSEVEKRLSRPIHGAGEVPLSPTAQETARHLYASFRELSSDANHVLWITKSDAQAGDDWDAVWDRVERASSLIL